MLDQQRDTVEMRSVPFVDVDADSDGSNFTGYASVFEEETDLGEFVESVARGAFRKVLATSTNVPMLFDHNAQLPPLATTRAGTLRLSEDSKGLRVEAKLGNHFVAEAVREMVRRDEIAGMSFGFVAGAGNSKIERRDGKIYRTLVGFKRLLDVSPTWDPAYASTVAELRNMTSIAVDLQQLLEGEEPQLEDGEEPTVVPDEVEAEQEAATGVTENRSVAARKRALELFIAETGGIDA
jgi:HK97 family phage prohead protease